MPLSSTAGLHSYPNDICESGGVLYIVGNQSQGSTHATLWTVNGSNVTSLRLSSRESSGKSVCVAPDGTILVAGSMDDDSEGRSDATLWKVAGGTITESKKLTVAENAYSYANGIGCAGSAIYVCGSVNLQSNNHATLWTVNGTAVDEQRATLSANFPWAYAGDLCVVGGQVYMCGQENNQTWSAGNAFLWKMGQRARTSLAAGVGSQRRTHRSVQGEDRRTP